MPQLRHDPRPVVANAKTEMSDALHSKPFHQQYPRIPCQWRSGQVLGIGRVADRGSQPLTTNANNQQGERTSSLKPFHADSKSFFLSSSSRRSTIMLTMVAEMSKFWSKTFQIDDIKSRAADSELR